MQEVNQGRADWKGLNVVVDIDSIRGFVVVEEVGDAMDRKLGKSPKVMDFDVGVVIQMNADRIGGDSIHPRLRRTVVEIFSSSSASFGGGDVSQVQDG
jgi:hypothetical protein